LFPHLALYYNLSISREKRRVPKFVSGNFTGRVILLLMRFLLLLARSKRSTMSLLGCTPINVA
jgi:hypothetical protein